MLKVCLRLKNPVLREALGELLPQAGIVIVEEERDSDGVLYAPPYTATDLPGFNFETLPRPFKLFDLLSQLKNLPYRQEITFSQFSLNLRDKTLTNLETGTEQRLTEKECQLLRLLSLNKGHDLSKERLLHEVWGYHPDAETHTLETHIYRLRQKLETDPNTPQVLLNGKDGYWIK